MSDGVCLSFAPGRTQIWAKVTNDWWDEESGARLSTLVRRNDRGDVLSREEFPPRIFAQPGANERHYKFGDFVIANALPVVSGAVAEVMSQFNLGNASLHPVPVFKRDKETLIEGDWFFLNYGNVKHVFVPEQSKEVSRIETTDYWSMPINPQDGDVAVSAEALEGPDIWVDPRCRKVFYLSQELASAIRERKLSNHFFKKCAVLPERMIGDERH